MCVNHHSKRDLLTIPWLSTSISMWGNGVHICERFVLFWNIQVGMSSSLDVFVLKVAWLDVLNFLSWELRKMKINTGKKNHGIDLNNKKIVDMKTFGARKLRSRRKLNIILKSCVIISCKIERQLNCPLRTSNGPYHWFSHWILFSK